MSAAKGIVTAGAVLLLASCAPHVRVGEHRDIHGGENVIVHKKDYQRYVEGSKKLEGIEGRIKILIESDRKIIEKNKELERLLKEAEGSLNQEKDRNKALEFKIANLVNLYLQTLKEDPRVRSRVDDPTYQSIVDILALSAFANHAQSPVKQPPEDLISVIEENFIDLDGCGGLLITNNGYFATASHCVEDLVEDTRDSVIKRGSEEYKIEKIIALDKVHDIALGKAEITQDFVMPNNIVIAKPKIGMGIEVYAEGMGYREIGKIVDISANGTFESGQKFRDSFITNNYVKLGFSGSPIFATNGKLVGFVSVAYGVGDDMYILGGCKATYLIGMINNFIEKQIDEISKKPKRPPRRRFDF
ncbi:serine protease [Candidatus Woesearchaeota archaeon]|nr:serine protease [Candidatus Woesearchaeota archaeon]